MASGRYWHHLLQEQPAGEGAPRFQAQLIARLGEMTGIAPSSGLDTAAGRGF